MGHQDSGLDREKEKKTQIPQLHCGDWQYSASQILPHFWDREWIIVSRWNAQWNNTVHVRQISLEICTWTRYAPTADKNTEESKHTELSFPPSLLLIFFAAIPFWAPGWSEKMIAGVEGAAKPLEFGLLLPKSSVTSVFGAASWLRCLGVTTINTTSLCKFQHVLFFGDLTGGILKDRAGFCLYMFWPDHSVPGPVWAVFHCSLGCEERCPHCQLHTEIQEWAGTQAWVVKQLQCSWVCVRF